MTTLIKNGNVFFRNKFEETDIFIGNDKKLVIASNIDVDADEVIDATGLHIMPGLIDVHTHLREPGFEYKETIKSGTDAAIKGGYTTIFCMPNLNPVTDNVEKYQKLEEIIKRDSQINVIPYVSITKDQLGKDIVDVEALAEHTLFFSDDGKGVQSDDIMKQAMTKVAKVNGMIVAHCEDESLLSKGGSVHDGILVNKFNQVGISSASESKQVERDIQLAEETKVQYHVCHVSTIESIQAIKQGKLKGVNVSGEVTPHHLILNENDVISDDGNFKMNPPLRTKEDQQALINALKDQTIEIIATDHAPHSIEEKSRGLKDSPMGIIGLEFAFSLLYTKLVKTNIISLELLVKTMSYNPANIFGIEGGYIDQGEIANLCIYNLKDNEKITLENIVSKSKNTPFLNQYVSAVNYMTIMNGKIIYRKGL